ncbi:hypothetical protein [Mycobacterium sp.]|uniref:hypothetical protein n=1 Tax=Mycobacterium sp. TaxID=1785 RepID=UPI003F9532CF
MNSNHHAHLDKANDAVVIENLTVRDKDVAREARRWTTGERGPIVDDVDKLAGADLSEFVAEAVKIGAHALSATGQRALGHHQVAATFRRCRLGSSAPRSARPRRTTKQVGVHLGRARQSLLMITLAPEGQCRKRFGRRPR